MKKSLAGFCILTTTLFGAAVGLLSLTPGRACAWGAMGHKVVARIAWDNLKPETRAKLIAMLAAAPADADLASLRPADAAAPNTDRTFFELAATWPDLLRSQKTDHDRARRAKYHHGEWHYTDIYFEQNETTGKITDRPDKATAAVNAVERLHYLVPRLADPTVDPGERAIDVSWIEHLVGDMATPLHNVSRITISEPDGDQGGNLFKLQDHDGTRDYPMSLHSYWDDLPDTTFPTQAGEDPEVRIGRIATEATDVLTKAMFDEEGLNQIGHYEEWNQEGAEVAKAKVYSPLLVRGEAPPEAYANEAKQTMLIALAKAGYRLASTLEAALAPKAAAPRQTASKP